MVAERIYNIPKGLVLIDFAFYMGEVANIYAVDNSTGIVEFSSNRIAKVSGVKGKLIPWKLMQEALKVC